MLAYLPIVIGVLLSLLVRSHGQGLTLELRGVMITDSQILITAVGEPTPTDDGGLVCRTDRNDCCDSGPGETRQGQWKFPNGSTVRNSVSGDDFYRNRDTRIVRLNRRNDVTGPTGLYCCEVASVDDLNARICINLTSPTTTDPTTADPTTVGPMPTEPPATEPPVTEPPVTAPGPVNDLQVTSPTATTLTITWTVSGVIDSFEITYSFTIIGCSGAGGPLIDIISGSMRSHTLRDLNEDSRYTITVRAVNTAGSTMAVKTADTLTAAPSGIPGSISFSDVTLTSITVQWTELPCSDRNREITGYSVEYDSMTMLVSGSNNRRLVVSVLLPRTSYTFRVRAQGASDSRSANQFTATPTELGFFLRGTLYPDNSIVLLRDIGEGSNALYCLTDWTQCCSDEAGERPRGLWRFPGGNNIGESSAANIYSRRGFSSISLNIRSGGTAGLYTCLIPDAGGVTRTLSINIENSLLPILSNLQFATPTATTLTITWTVSGAIDRFEVTCSYTVNRCSAPQGAPRTVTISDGSMRSHTLRDLIEDSRYTITVRAISTAGSTMATIMANTLTAAPSAAPEPISLSDANLTSITVQWTELPCSDRNGEITGYTVEYSSTTPPPHTNTVTVFGSSNTRLVVVGLLPRTNYTFSVRAQGDGSSNSATATMFTAIATDVRFFLNGRLLPNNSIVAPGDIREGSGALYCLTDRTQCCSTEAGGELGVWRSPDGSDVSGSTTADVYIVRGFSSILLNRRSSAEGPTGIYTCVIPNVGDVLMTLYVGIYDDITESVEITGNEEAHQIGSSADIICSSDLAVETIRWLNDSDDGQELFSSSGQQQLLLQIDSVSSNMADLMYTCKITLVGTGVVQRTITFLVNNTRLPRLPTSLDVGSITSSSATIQWMLTDPYPPSRPETFIVSYGITSTQLNTPAPGVTANQTSQTYTTQLNSLEPATEYFYRIETRNRFAPLFTGVIFTGVRSFITRDGVSSVVTGVQSSTHNDTTLVISWRPPDDPKGDIMNYSVSIINLGNGNPVRQDNLIDTSLTQTDLEPGVPYNVSIAAVNEAGVGEFTAFVNFSQELKPRSAPMGVNATRTSPTVMVVSWIPLNFSEARGFISNYTVAYSPQPSGRKRQPSDTPTKVVPGMDSNSTTIENLDRDTEYGVQVSATNGAETSDPSPAAVVEVVAAPGGSGGGGSPVIGIVVGIILAVALVAVLIVIVLIIMLRRRGKKYTPASKEAVQYINKKGSPPKKSPGPKKPVPLPSDSKAREANNGTAVSDELDEQFYENTVFLVQDRMKPVPVEEFGGHVQRMHADRDKFFELEYTAIEKSPQADHEVAKIPDNKARNRFGNIFPYDFNRVVLNDLPGQEHSDYINASYVDGYKRKQVYIGSQGPTENSVQDFWRMIWEQRVPTVVMLTRIYEGRKKCEAYWPENADEPFVPTPGCPLTVTYKSVMPFAEFVIRKMVVTNCDEPGSKPLEVTQFHYLAWPDHGVPNNAISMVNFIKRVRKTHPYSRQDLLLVHCSAGVGRTGTFITLDSMLERMKAENSLNIYEYVCSLRKQRVLMVQTPTQYIFIHNALDELITCGETEIAAANMRIIIGKLRRLVPQTGITGFERQFGILNKVTADIRNVDTSNATNDVNIPKNRYQDKIPYNHSRVRLRPSAAQGSDYINACFIDGYRQKGAYIANQGPLPHTVNDFWRMVWEQEVKCIVMLCKTEENHEEVCSRYWPEGRGTSETYGKYLVTFKKQEVCGDYVIRKMEIMENQTRMSVSTSGFAITQFQYMKWPEDGVPQSTTGILEVANLVQKVQMGTGNKAIAVMCNDGVGRTGAFVSIHAEMERMKAETVVDLFQFIKASRIQRNGLVSNKEQYEFCHQVLADFLDGFDTYANFKEII